MEKEEEEDDGTSFIERKYFMRGWVCPRMKDESVGYINITIILIVITNGLILPHQQ